LRVVDWTKVSAIPSVKAPASRDAVAVTAGNV